MTTYKSYLLILSTQLLLLIAVSVHGQTVYSRAFDIAYNKTSSIVFPSTITSVDRGSRDVLVQKAKGVDNVLFLKAAKKGFQETNLTVITADGVLHPFTVNYSSEPTMLVVTAAATTVAQTPTAPLIFHDKSVGINMKKYGIKILKSNRDFIFKTSRRENINLKLKGIYIQNDVMYYHFEIVNNSNISYDIDVLRFYIQDKQQMKRTASQEINVNPLYTLGNAKKVNGNGSNNVVFAFEKFTLPKTKRFVIEMLEQNGGRNNSMPIKNNTIIKARPLQ